MRFFESLGRGVFDKFRFSLFGVDQVKPNDGNFTYGHGHPSRMGMVWARIYAHSQYPNSTRLVMGRARVRFCAHGYAQTLPGYLWVYLAKGNPARPGSK